MTDILERTDQHEPEEDGEEHPSHRPRTRWRSGVFMALLVVAGFAATGVLPVREYLERGDSVEAALLELDQVTAENAALSEDISALHTDEGVERLAREQYGFVKPGEIGYVATPPPDVEGGAVEPSRPVESVSRPTLHEERSFLQRIWDFVTGSDLTNDG